MNKDWTLWYRDKTGESWSKENSDKKLQALASKLNKKDRKIMELLYSKYSENTDTLSTIDKQIDGLKKANTEAAKESQIKREKVIAASKETLRASGNISANKPKARADEIKQAYQSNATERENTLQDKVQKLADGYSEKVQKEQRKTNATIRTIDNNYEDESKAAYKTAINEIDELIQQYKAKDGKSYYANGKEKAVKLVEDRKEQLGSQYEKAVEYVNALPEYTPEPLTEPTIEIKTEYETLMISNLEKKMLDAVKYKSNAGWLVVYGDNFKVELDGKVYRIEGGNLMDEEKNQRLRVLAKNADVALSVGSVLYFRDAVYVYSGNGKWRIAAEIGKSSEGDGLNSLIKALQQKERSYTE